MTISSQTFGQQTISVVLNEGQMPAKLSTDSNGNTVLVGGGGTEYPLLKGSAFLEFTSNIFLTGNGAENFLLYDTEEYDDLGVHDTSTNTSRIVIPAGVSRARFTVGIDTQATPTNSLLTYTLYKNGAFFAQIFQRGFVAGSADTYGVYVSQVPEIRGLVEGDYFEVVVTTTAGNNFHGLVGSANRASYFAADFY